MANRCGHRAGASIPLPRRAQQQDQRGCAAIIDSHVIGLSTASARRYRRSGLQSRLSGNVTIAPNRLVAEISDANVCPRIELPRFTRVNASVGEDASAKGTKPDLERVLPERVDPPRVAWRPLMRSRLVGTEVLSWIPVMAVAASARPRGPGCCHE